jgi:hypothetical protein
MGFSLARRVSDNTSFRPTPLQRAAVNLDSALSVRLPELAARWRAGDLSAAAYASGYFLLWQIALHGRRFASRKSKADPKPDAATWLAILDASADGALDAALTKCFERHHFLGVIPNVPAAFLAWLRGEWPLILTERIPSPDEVLAMQAAGTRPVTVIADYARALRPVLTKANGFAFLVHDLEHAYKFFHDPRLHWGQRRFFTLLLDAYGQGVFEPYRSDRVFADRFDYLMSDMNTHVVHSLRFLGAVLIECLLRREGKSPRDELSPRAEAEIAELMRGLGRLWAFPAAAGEALLRLVEGGFGDADAALVEQAVLAGSSRLERFA